MRLGSGVLAILFAMPGLAWAAAGGGSSEASQSSGSSSARTPSPAATARPADGSDSTAAAVISLQFLPAKSPQQGAGRAADAARAPDSLESPTLTLHGPVRGDASAAMALRITPKTSTIALAVPPLDLPKSAWVRVELRSADGKVLASGRHRQSEFTQRRLLVMSSGPRPLKPGRYTLSLGEAAAGNDSRRIRDSAEYTFDLRSSDR